MANQTWRTCDYATKDEWRTAWLELVRWARCVTARYAAWQRKDFFLRIQSGRVCAVGKYSKGRFLRAMWLAGSPIGLPLPLCTAKLPSPARALDGVAGAARRSLLARLFVGDLDIAAYSGNWDLRGRGLPSRACAYCFRRYSTWPFVEDEWHVFFVCQLYAPFRARLPIRLADMRVQGHPMQGDGCTPQNLVTLARAVLRVKDQNLVAEFLMRSMAARRRTRAQL